MTDDPFGFLRSGDYKVCQIGTPRQHRLGVHCVGRYSAQARNLSPGCRHTLLV
jgi:hypothetical protein